MKSGVIWIWCCLILLSLLQLAFVSTSTLADEVHEQEAEDYDDEDTLLKEILLENQMEDAEYVDDTAHDVNPDGRSSSHNEEQQQKQTKASPRSPGGRRGNVRSKLDTSVHNRPANGKSKTQTSRSKGSNGGSYYGENKAKEQRELLQKREAGQKSKEKSKITSMSGDRRRQIESLLSENVRANIAQGEEEQASRNAEKLQRQMRYKMSRKFAKPVEDVLEIYNAVDVDFYKLLDVKKQWDENKIKKQYRMKALIVHPDKNPHPDAKNAFDALQDAYDTLSSPSKRVDYDKERQKLANSRKLTWKRLQRKAKDCYRNTVSIVQLSLAQHKRGESMEIVTNIKECFQFKWQQIEHYWEHFSLLPSLNDKLAFLLETIKKKQVYLGLVMILLLVKSMNYPDLKVLFSL